SFFRDRADLAYTAVLPNPGIWVVGPDQSGIAPKMDRKKFRSDRCSDVHRTAIHAYDESCSSKQPDQLKQIGPINERNRITVNREILSGLPHNNHPERSE